MSIFISYAKEDAITAEALYLAMHQRDMSPWMDKPPVPHRAKGLVPGEYWRDRLDREIRNACRVILLLSATSIAKVGYVQREFRLALDVMNSMPPNARFVVPLLIEDCEPPALVVGNISLNDLQWTDLSEIGMDEFLDSLSADIAND